MRDRRLDVVVAVPSYGSWRAETGKSLFLLGCYFPMHRVGDAVTQKLSITTVESSKIEANRHILLKKCCQDQNRTHMLFIDADMDFPMNLLNRLLEHDKDVVATNCTTRMEPILPVAFSFDDKRIDSRGKTGLQKVRQVGAAIMLIRLDCVRKLKPPFFLADWIPAMQNTCGEDVYFCQVLQAAGIDIWIDHDVSLSVRHVGTRSYGHEDIKEMKD